MKINFDGVRISFLSFVFIFLFGWSFWRFFVGFIIVDFIWDI